MTGFGLAGVINPVSVADKVKSDDFDIWSDLNLTCDLLIYFLNCSKSTHRKLLLAASPTSLRPRVRELGRADALYPLGQMLLYFLRGYLPDASRTKNRRHKGKCAEGLWSSMIGHQLFLMAYDDPHAGCWRHRKGRNARDGPGAVWGGMTTELRGGKATITW